MRELEGAGQVPPGRAGSTGRAAIFRPASPAGSAAEVSAAVAEYLRDIGAETVECCYPDLLGALVGRTMTVPRFLDTLDGGFGMPMATLAWNLVGDIEPLDVVSAATGFPNMRAFPDLSTLRPSAWRPATALCLCDTRSAEGGPTGLDSRDLVRSAAAGLAELGVSITIGSEIEFYLTTESREPLADDHKCFSLDIAGEAEPALADIRSALMSSGIEVESSQTEYGPGQFEINTAPGSPLDVADSAAVLKYLVKRVARRHGLRATFMAKPFPAGSASGLHIHQAVAAAADGSAGSVHGLPHTTGCYLAGLLALQPELTAMCMPTVTAYKRMADYSMAANRAVWGVDNRTALIRVIDDTPVRIESRIGSSDANPYHVIASCLAAGSSGVRDRMTPPTPVTGDAYQLAEAPRLPGSLTESAVRFGSSEFARKSFGDVFVDVLATVCEREADQFHASVTDWERRRYFDLA
jgi:glutamine synthetase